ncbi:hypothetical protein [Massilia sp. Dwa41.01b]|uniref:hypothetical protein n=1 Tax=Massilia sp. Dwa41.01b TaxID=2709302 RepID=UPI001601F6F2|nr:hypothetical protein [Massilia sp. Dwa41.01b]QNA98622.1 hypothetical protein G4G31_06910 [Massilia sp. Se16.2.3]
MNTENERCFRSSLTVFGAVSLTVLAAVMLVLIFVRPHVRMDPETSMVRVSNDTGVPINNIILNDVSFGYLSNKQISEYKPLTNAYPYAHLRLEVANKKFEWMPDDHYGEKPLGKGNYTYSIRRAETPVGPQFEAHIRDDFEH